MPTQLLCSWLFMTPSMLLAIYEYEYSSHHHLD